VVSDQWNIAEANQLFKLRLEKRLVVIELLCNNCAIREIFEPRRRQERKGFNVFAVDCRGLAKRKKEILGGQIWLRQEAALWMRKKVIDVTLAW
jgi:hypothetical protein